MLSRTKIIVAAVLAAGGIAVALFLLTRRPEVVAEAPPPPKTVAVVKAGRADLVRTVSITAEMRPWEEIDVHAKVTGYLKSIDVDIGDRVRQGQVFARLDVPELDQDQNKAAADYRVAKLDYDRVQAVQKRQPGLLAQVDVDKAEAVYGVAKATLERMKILSDYATISAPFDGVVTWRFVDPGALIQSGTAPGSRAIPIVHLADILVLRLDFPAPESIVPLMRVGMPVEVVVSATHETIHATVARLTDKVDQETRTMTVEIDLDNRDLRLKPGMYATATIALEKKARALAAPLQAVLFGDKPTVWLVHPDGAVEQRAVTLGIQTPDFVEITSGCVEGDLLVGGSRGEIAAGMKVTPKLIDATTTPG